MQILAMLEKLEITLLNLEYYAPDREPKVSRTNFSSITNFILKKDKNQH